MRCHADRTKVITKSIALKTFPFGDRIQIDLSFPVSQLDFDRCSLHHWIGTATSAKAKLTKLGIGTFSDFFLGSGFSGLPREDQLPADRPSEFRKLLSF